MHLVGHQLRILIHVYQFWRGTYWLRFSDDHECGELKFHRTVHVFFNQTTRCHIPEDNVMVIAVRTVLALFASQSIKNIYNYARQQVIKHHAIHQLPALDFVYFSSRRISDSTNLFGKRSEFTFIFCRET